MPIRDTSYYTVRHGLIRSFRGYEVIGEPGSRVLRVGYPPLGTAEILIAHGGIAERREVDIGTREFELRVLELQYAHGEIPYAEYAQRLLAMLSKKED